MTSYQKSDSINRCVFIWRTILLKSIPIRWVTTQLLTLFWIRVSPQQDQKEEEQQQEQQDE